MSADKPGWLYGIENMLLFCKENINQCSQSQIIWIGRIDSQYIEKEWISMKQVKILQDIYYDLKEKQGLKERIEREEKFIFLADDIYYAHFDELDTNDTKSLLEALCRRCGFHINW